MCLRRAPEKYITGAALDMAAVECVEETTPSVDLAALIGRKPSIREYKDILLVGLPKLWRYITC
jgi:hypothetical protein